MNIGWRIKAVTFLSVLYCIAPVFCQQQQYQPVVQELVPVIQAPTAVGNTAAPVTTNLSDQTVVSGDELKTDVAKEKPAKKKADPSKSHKPLFFDNDFSYVCDDTLCESFFGDRLKQRCLPGGGSYDIGGQYRMRAHFERNMRGLGLTGVDDKFLLHRTRIYGDFRFTRNVRVYAEMLDAESNFENFGPRPIEVNRTEMQNLFVDARLVANGDQSLTARIGRQELLFGAQRAVSPLDWANTRRSFEGGRLMWKSKDHTFDAFYANPLQVDDHSFDSRDQDQQFMGLYSSYTGTENQTVDAYVLNYDNESGANDFNFTTIGTRWQGSCDTLLWDFETAYQLGENTDGSSHVGGMMTMGLGRKLQGAWNPTLWAFYDWASGDDARGLGNGFHHSFPLAHKYNGFMDLFGRRNLEDVNLRLSLQPTKRLKLLAWYHYLFLESKTDTPYSVVMSPFNGGNNPGSPELGHEIDFVATYALGKRQQLLAGYSHFYSGEYYNTTAGVPFNGDANFFYTQWTMNF